MQRTICTDRLKLTLIEKSEQGSKELEWVHEIKSDEKAQWWRLEGTLKTPEETEKLLKDYLPLAHTDASQKPYRIFYAVHELLPDSTPRLIGSVSLRSLSSASFTMPTISFPPPTPPYLTLELSYQFLPYSWSRGFATESLNAVFAACRAARGFWDPWRMVYVRAIVVAENTASMRVVEKGGLSELGVVMWEGEPVWLAGRMSGREELRIWGGWLVE